MPFKVEKSNIITNFLEKKKIFYIENFQLKKESWLKAGGDFKVLIQPKDLNEIHDVLFFFKNNEINFYTVGNISNVIFRDGMIRTPIINLKKFNKINIKNSNKDYIEVDVDSGVSIFKFVTFVSSKLKISGLEGLVGIPGTLGGAVYMNSSSYDSYISEFIKEVLIIDKNCEIVKLSKKDLNFKWRSSIFHKMKDFIILNILFEFPKKLISNTENINNRILIIKNHRIKFQEKKLPNLGSLFATKDLYSDIAKASLKFKILNILNKFITKIILKISNEDILLIYRKLLIKIYSIFFGILNKKSFSLSDRTINCLVNNGSNNANEAIEIIKKIEKKINYAQKLENIIIDNID